MTRREIRQRMQKKRMLLDTRKRLKRALTAKVKKKQPEVAGDIEGMIARIDGQLAELKLRQRDEDNVPDGGDGVGNG